MERIGQGEIMLIPRKTFQSMSPQIGTYRMVTLDGIEQAKLCCPKCGSEAYLDDHEILEDGRVIPSIVCARENCSFHEYITLKDWGNNG